MAEYNRPPGPTFTNADQQEGSQGMDALTWQVPPSSELERHRDAIQKLASTAFQLHEETEKERLDGIVAATCDSRRDCKAILAINGSGKLVAALATRTYQAKDGGPVWEGIEPGFKQRAEMWAEKHSVEPQIAYIQEAMVDPNSQRKRIASTSLQIADAARQPVAWVAASRNPSYVCMQAQALHAIGYRTFVGRSWEVIRAGTQIQLSIAHYAISGAWLQAFDREPGIRANFHTFTVSNASGDRRPVGTTNIPPGLYGAFRGLQVTQEQTEDSTSLLVFSIRSEILG